MSDRMYLVDFRKLALLLLPTFCRRPLFAALVQAAVSPLGSLHARFTAFRTSSNYRLSHNGQVCYLQAVLNDMFDSVERRITIADVGDDNDNFTLYHRNSGPAKLIPRRNPARRLIINRRGFAGVNRYDFEVKVPAILQSETTTARLSAIVNTYKLATKRFVITYISYS